MQQYRCIKARVGVDVGGLVEVPDGAAVSPLYYEPVDQAPAGPAPAPEPVPADVTVKGGAGQ